jgi:folate-binding protein YgfZ
MILLENRGVLSVGGQDAITFLDNLLTNNIDKATDDIAVFAGLLSPQGKYLFDMFVVRRGDEFLLDCNAPQELFKRLKMYKLRSKVEIVDLSNEMAVFSDFENTNIGFKDPRHDKMGNRIIAPINTPTNSDFADYEQIRISLGIPELQQDLIRDGDFALEGLMDEMGAIDFHKGCYVGQEMTSRMKRRTNVKNKLLQISFEPPAPEFNCPIKANDTIIGYVRSVINNIGIALIRGDKLENALTEGQKLLANGTEIFIPNPK